MKRLCVYCGSSAGKKPQYMAAARALAKELLERNIGLVYGGASVGIMGVIADEVLSGGGEVIGVIPQSLVEKEVSHEGLSKLEIVSSMHQRKKRMADLADGFIALPGGLGTLEELFEVLTWSQLGFHSKPASLLNVEGYYDNLLLFLDNAVEQQFVKAIHRQLLLVEDQPKELLDAMASYTSAVVDKWISEGQT